MHRVRIKYAKENPYIGHLDVVRLWERAIRRTEIPVLYTEGFNPRQKISFGPPLPMGFTSDCELLDLYLKEKYDLEKIKDSLNSVLPQQIIIKDIFEIPINTPSLTSEIKFAVYTTRVKEDISSAIKKILSINEIISKRGSKSVNIRQMIKDISQKGNILKLVVQCDNFGSLKGNEIKELFENLENLEFRRTEFIFQNIHQSESI